MDRRHLLIGAAGFAAAASPVGGEAHIVPRRPAGVTRLRGSALEVVFDPVRAVPLRYAYQGRHFAGETERGAPRAILCRLAPRAYATLDVKVGPARQRPGAVSFPCRLERLGGVAAAFDLIYSIAGATLVLTLENVVERPGYELIEIALPRLVSVGEAQAGAWFAEGRDGGSFARLTEARVKRLDDDDNFGRISIQLPVGMVGAEGVGALMEVQAYMDGTETEIAGVPGARKAHLGVVQVHRVHGGRCYNMNDGTDGNCGDKTTPNLLVEQRSRTRLDFFAAPSADQPWLDGAKLLRARMPAPITPYFNDRLIYIIAGKNKTEPKPRTTFAQSRQLIRDVARLTDGAPQVNYISGWVYDGQDTGYPSEDKINESLGTYEELRALMEDARAWNANVTLNVNWDDAYKSSPLFDEAFIARRPDGKLWASRAWDGELAYIVGMAKFVQGGWGPRRMAYTLERYKIRDALLIDAMTWYAIRNDWDRDHPASGYKNLVDGKFKVMEQARAAGVHVASEQLRYPFIGRMALAMNGPTVSGCPFGGEPVPLAATVYRHATLWGDDGGEHVAAASNLFWNNRPNHWFEAATPREAIADFYFTVTLPFSKLHNLAVEGYALEGDTRRLRLADRSEITLSRDGQRGSATWRGTRIVENGAVTCPIDDTRIAFYAGEARSLHTPLPAGWSPAAVTARVLSTESRAPFAVRVKDGLIQVETPARRPVIVYRDAAAAERQPVPS